MLTTPAACRIKNEESNPFHANPGLSACRRAAKQSAGMNVQEPYVRGEWRRWLKRLRRAALAGVLLTGAGVAIAQPAVLAVTPMMRWTNGPWASSNYFPIGVWMQDPAYAERFQQAGMNTWVGLWEGPTEDQLAALKKTGMWVVCEQNETGRRHRDDPAIIGWMHGDEPDNGQSWGARFGFGSPIPPEQTLEDYRRMKAWDPSRPVLLSLGQGVAWDGWYGRGNRDHHPEDYPEYLKGCDIASFDIYPANHESREVRGNLWFVAQGVERLVQWSQGKKIVWNAIECTAIDDPRHKPTPQQVRAEVWMSLIHGSRGVIYFVHQFKPKSVNAALLDDPEMLAAVTRINQQIAQLAPVLNRPSLRGAVTVQSKNPDVPVAVMAKQSGEATYVFAVGMRAGATEAAFTLTGTQGDFTAEVLGENRTFTATNGSFSDHFDPWAVHLYKLPAPR
jgi:hypothetical protein